MKKEEILKEFAEKLKKELFWENEDLIKDNFNIIDKIKKEMEGK